MRNKDFIAFILTHGRPDRVYTYKTLRKCGYTGRIAIIVDNEDATADEYRKIYGNEVICFNKIAVANTFDEGDNFNDRRAIIYARNACFEIAKNLNITYFIELDDDYTTFSYKFNANLEYRQKAIKNLDAIFDILLEYYKSINAKSIAMAQNGDFVGGDHGGFSKAVMLKRKCMNTFICSTDRPFKFIGRINEDVNTYTRLGNVGDLFLTVNNIAINQKQTQSNRGGMTDLYLDSGTYVKSFYTVMYSPFCAKVAEMCSKNKRLHHRISWNNAVPKIIHESLKK